MFDGAAGITYRAASSVNTTELIIEARPPVK